MSAVNILIGTKAQFIKTAPLIKECVSQNIPYRLIDTCQHKDITEEIRKLFKIKKPDSHLSSKYENINTLFKACFWLINIALSAFFQKKKFREKIFGPKKKGVCLIHGDTLSTLLGLTLAKYYRFKVMHLEAGLRSFNSLNPFPEELIRIVCMKFSDYLIAPSIWAVQNLKKMKTKGKIYNLEANTVLDSINYILKTPRPIITFSQSDYALISIHRFENIYSKNRLQIITKLALEVSNSNKVIFVLHQPTIKKIKSYGLYKQLEKNKNTILTKITNYQQFIFLIQKANFIITDGGSIQEECFYLNKPCLLMRKQTERLYGIKENVCLSGFNEKKISHFLRNYPQYIRKEQKFAQKPSTKIATLLKNICSTAN
jgi:UDP-N-acetylglucosamine 2-epimerase